MRECSDVLALATGRDGRERGPSLQPVKDNHS